MKTALGLLTLGVTVAIVALVFFDIGGGYAAVDTATLRGPAAFEMANPAYPGIVGRLRMRFTGAPLPPPRMPVSNEQVCGAAAERAVFVRTVQGTYRRFEPGHHCRDGVLTMVYSPLVKGALHPVPLALVPTPIEVFFRLPGVRLVPAELWAKIRGRA